jgi:hypothetical protein
MTTQRRILVASALVAAVAAATAAFALGGGAAGPPKPALVTSHGLRARTVVGSYCSTGDTQNGVGVGGCGDAAYPLHPKAFLPMTPRSRIRANLRKRTKKLAADLIRVDGSEFNVVGPALTAKPVPGSHRRIWRLRLPRDLRDANVLAITANFSAGGDGDFWAGVKPVERWP